VVADVEIGERPNTCRFKDLFQKKKQSGAGGQQTGLDFRDKNKKQVAG
jgi:hypothetical protein